jgi:NAD-dependent SIR2 family protein deacetylase
MGGFSFTSNIDGHWLQAGFREEQVLECHGTLRYMQCQGVVSDCPYKEKIWPANNEGILNMQIDPETDRVTSALPKCPGCDNPSRPNVLMFGDFYWQPDRNCVQEQNFKAWLKSISK